LARRLAHLVGDSGPARFAALARDLPRRQFRPGEKRGAAVGKTKRGKGTKWVVLVDGEGVPLGALLASATPHEINFAEATLAQVKVPRPHGRPRTKPQRIIADKGYDTAGFVQACRERGVTPHVAQNLERSGGSAIDRRTTRHASYQLSQRIRKSIEEHYGWTKTIGRIRQTVYRGLRRVDLHFKLNILASNIVRMARMPGVVPTTAVQGA